MCIAAMAPLVGAAGSATAASSMGLAIQGISAVGKTIGTIGAIKAQNDASARNARSAKDAYYLKVRQTNLRLAQEQRQASMMKRDNDLKAMKAQSSALVSAAAGGVQGAVIDQLLEDYERSEGLMASRIDTKVDNMASQASLDNLSFQSEANNRINNMQPTGFAESLFKVSSPLLSFGVDYYEDKEKQASLRGNT